MATKKKTQAAEIKYTARIQRHDFSVALRFDYQGQDLRAERLRSALIFQIAAALEIAAADLGRRWPVCPAAPDGIIKIECDEHEKTEAVDLIAAACRSNGVSVVVVA